MIDIAEVLPTPRECRPLSGGWGAIHWICLLPTHAFLLGFVIFGIAAVSLDEAIPSGLFVGVLVGSWAVWQLGMEWQRRTTALEARKAPVGGLSWRWRIDGTGLRFDSGLQSNWLDWRGVKQVRDEKDRFVFLVSPANNPVLPKRLLTDRQAETFRALLADLRASGRLGGGVDYPPPPSDKA